MLIVIYDGECVICNSTRRLVTALDWMKRIHWVDLHDSSRVSREYPGLDYAEAMGQLHARDSHSNQYAGFLATRRMLKELPLTYPLWLLMYVPGMTRLGHHVYRFIAQRRYGVNRLVGKPACDAGTCRLN